MSNFALVRHQSGKAIDERELGAIVDEISRFGGITEVIRLQRHTTLVTNYNADWQQPPVFHRQGHSGCLIPTGLPNKDISESEIIRQLLRSKENNNLFGSAFQAVVWDETYVRLVADPVSRCCPYYTVQGSSLICGTRERIVLAHPSVSKEPDLDIVGEYLCHNIATPDRTVYADIKSVPAGSTLQFSRQGVSEMQWARFNTLVDRKSSLGELSERILKTTNELFPDYLPDETGPHRSRHGLYFSGGLDSSILAGLLRESEQDSFCTALMHRFPGLPCDETTYQDSVLEGSQFHHEVISAREFEPERDLIEFTRQCQLPLYVGNPVGTDSAHLCNMLNIHSVISGAGGDELFAPYSPTLLDLFLSGDLSSATRLIRNSPTKQLVKKHLPMLPSGLRAMARSYRPRPWLGPELVQRRSLAKNLEAHTRRPGLRGLAIERMTDCIHTGYRTVNRDHWAFLADRFGFNVVTPFYDPRLLQLAVNIPESMRASPEDARHLQRYTFRSVLPSTLTSRRGKVHFDYQYAKDLQHPWICDTLHNLRLAELGLVTSEEVVALHNRLAVAVRTDIHSIPPLAGILWAIVGIETWWRQCVD